MKMGHPVQICGISLYCSHKGKWIKLMLTDHWWILTDLPYDNNYSPNWFMSFEAFGIRVININQNWNCFIQRNRCEQFERIKKFLNLNKKRKILMENITKFLFIIKTFILFSNMNEFLWIYKSNSN